MRTGSVTDNIYEPTRVAVLDKRLMLTGCSDFRCRFKMKNGELYDLQSNNLNECARQSFSTIYSRFDFCRKSLQNYN